MANEVKIKLTADGSQVRKEIKLIDQAMEEIGGKSSKKTGQSSKQSERIPRDTDSKEKLKQESRDKVNTQLLREMTLIRKELQKYNGTAGSQGTGGGGNTPPPSSGSGNNTPEIPSNGKGSGDGKGIGAALGKLATAAAALKVASIAFSAAQSASKSAATGESLAYQTYGSTLAYDNYRTARKDAAELGTPYGYSIDTVLNAGNTNMSKAGWKDIDSYNADMSAIFSTSKAWGLDPSTLAQSSGYMTSIGVTQAGEQKKFADMLAQSIVQAEMTGREDEQLQVLESIAENLNSRSITVSADSLSGSLGLYNALVNQNSNLKGTSGANLVTSMNDLAASGNSTLDILAGYGTTYTGLQGKLSLMELQQNDPDAYWRQVAAGAKQYGIGDDQLRYFLAKQLGSIDKADEAMKAINSAEFQNGETNISDTTEGKLATQERNQNYSDSSVSTQEEFDVNAQNATDRNGDLWNSVKNLGKDFYNNASGGTQQFLNGIGKIGVPAAGIAIGSKVAPKLLSGILGKIGLGGAAGAGTAAAGEGAAAAGGGAAAAGGGISLTGLGIALPLVAAAPLLTSGGSYKHLTQKGRESDSNDWMDKYALEMAQNGTSLDDKWEEVQYTNGVFYGNYNKDDLANRSEARTEMMNFYNSEEGMKYFQSRIQDRLNSGGKIDENYLSGLLSWTSDNGTTYTGSQGDIDELLSNMYGDTYEKQEGGWYSGRWGDSYINKFLKKNNSSFDISEANTNDLQYDGDTLVTQDNTNAVEQLTTEVSEMRKWLEENGYHGTAVWTDENVKNTYNEAHGVNTQSNLMGSNSNTLGLFGINSLLGRRGLFGTSHATGNDYVPYDNYQALLHKGEMVLTSSEADDYRQGKVGNGNMSHATGNDVTLNINVSGSIAGMTPENQNQIVAAIVSQMQGGQNLQGLLSNGFTRVQNF